MKMTEITIKLEGRPEDRGDVRLGDFLEFFGDMLRCLRGVDRLVSDKEKLSADYRITGLRHGGATVVIEPIVYPKAEDRTNEIVKTFTEGLASMQEKGKAPPRFDRPLMESFRALAKPLSKRVARIEVGSPKRKVRITKELETNIDRIIGEDIISEGSAGGYLDVVNVHEKNAFFIYPAIGTRIECFFAEALLERVKNGIKRHVEASGTLRYKTGEVYPYRVDVKDIDVYPPEEELPTLESLRGIAPDITGDLDSVQFIRKLRSEW